MMRRLLLFLTFTILTLTIVKGQKYYLTNQYVYDLFQMNPSAAAYQKNCISANVFFQKQWLGTEMSPTTQIMSFQIPVTGHLGSGTYVYNDRNGFHKEMGLNQAFSYELLLKDKRNEVMTLSFGLSFLVENTSLDFTGLSDGAEFDPAITGSELSGFGFNAGTGVLFKYNDMHIGFAVTNLLPETNPMFDANEEPQRAADMHIHAGGSYKIADRDLYLEPLLLYRRNSLTDKRFDANLKIYMPTPDPDFSLWGLLAYRHTMDHRIGKSLGMAVTGGVVYRNFSVGLEYQLGLTTAQIDYGSSYQLVLGYRICKDKSKGAIPCSKKFHNKKYNYKFLGY